jgi:hypothetical protein
MPRPGVRRYCRDTRAGVGGGQGYDDVAHKIKAIAKERGIPQVENIALAARWPRSRDRTDGADEVVPGGHGGDGDRVQVEAGGVNRAARLAMLVPLLAVVAAVVIWPRLLTSGFGLGSVGGAVILACAILVILFARDARRHLPWWQIAVVIAISLALVGVVAAWLLSRSRIFV